MPIDSIPKTNNHLISLKTIEWARFSGYLAAAQYMFVRGELDLTLESTFYEITNAVSDEEVIQSTYSTSNEINYRQEITLEEMKGRIDQILNLTRVYWDSKYQGMAVLVEKKDPRGILASPRRVYLSQDRQNR